MIEEGSEAISPAPHHDIYSIEDLRQLVNSLKEATQYEKPIIVKVAAVHNIAAICSGIARSGADIIYIDGMRGGSGAVPTRIRDHVGIPLELALASVDQTLREEGIREDVSIIAAGGIRNSADVLKAIALGADVRRVNWMPSLKFQSFANIKTSFQKSFQECLRTGQLNSSSILSLARNRFANVFTSSDLKS